MPGVGPVLFDWENVGPAPRYADVVFYLAAAKAVGLPVREDLVLTEAAVAFWQDEISQRFGASRRDDRLADAMLRALVRLSP
jgi:hypothetical protein